ncbi:AlkZ family DNA glycosylase [Actinoplanes sp. LDG1-01]|uniref:AlkZ family DNA glycosylase n=2 Tax=Paractinoplanes lichenicola TaxID=2802976 RepID=A0ABS1VR16_9ACTN|nr:AlkZ family DNA glycosylase [Actinoplanes lichenicola]
MAYRVTALGLAERSSARPADLPVLDLGVQEYTPGSAQVALAARTGADLADRRLITVWAARGAPHLHRRADLAALVKQLWPISDADASARIKSSQIPDGMKLGLEAFRVTAAAFREVVREPMPRGEVSTEVSKRVPKALTYECRSCEARHIAGNVWQHSGLAGGVEVQSRGRDAMLGPLAKAPPIPAENAGIDELILTYLRFLGPAGPLEVGKYLGSSTAEMKSVWPAERLTPVTVEGRKAWLPTEAIEELTSASSPGGVRFVPPMDPLLQARDRDVLVPGRERQKEVWRILGNPGALLVDGEVAGVWRAKMSGKRVNLTVTSFGSLPAARRKQIEEESAEVARARGVPEAAVAFE